MVPRQTKFWEAALAKRSAACEALLRIHQIFEFDERFRKDNPPSTIKALRQKHLSPLVHDFLAFAAESYDAHKGERGPLRSAFGYCVPPVVVDATQQQAADAA